MFSPFLVLVCLPWVMPACAAFMTMKPWMDALNAKNPR